VSKPHPFVARRPDTRQLQLGMGRNLNEARYREWAMRNPDVIVLFLQFARERLRSDRRFGMKALVERVRWDEPVPIERSEGFRLNNSAVAYLARDLVKIEPGLKRLIRLRRVKGEV
jgi:hypothetical protein